MSRYIDADELKVDFYDEYEAEDDVYVCRYVSEYQIDSAPSIDVVFCKECVHCADDWNGNQPMFTCELGRCGESVQPNDFCSYGERKESE